MNPFTILQLMSTAATMAPQLASLAKLGFHGITPGVIGDTLPTLEPLLAELGSLFSPSAPAAVHSTIAALSLVLHGKPAAGIQEALNDYLNGTPGYVLLIVDGAFGPKSWAAVLMAQTKAGIKADGWFGKATALAIGYVAK